MGTSFVSNNSSALYKPGIRLYYPTFRSSASSLINGMVSKLSLSYCGIKVYMDIERGFIMQEAAVLPLPTWQNFYVITGTAAATLTGLMFVAMTLTARVRNRKSNETLGTFASPTVVHFCTVLLVAAILSAPWQALWNASLLLGLTGFGGVTYAVIVVLRARRQSDYQLVLEDWLWYTAFPIVSYIAFFVAAILLPVNPAPALFVIAAATLVLLFTSIHNAWDTVTYLAVYLSLPENMNQD